MLFSLSLLFVGVYEYSVASFTAVGTILLVIAFINIALILFWKNENSHEENFKVDSQN